MIYHNLPSASLRHVGHLTAVLFLASVCGCVARNDAGSKIDPTQVTSIAIEHTACYGKCPCYSVDFCADGTVQYKGKMFVERKGVRTGTVLPEKFEELAKFVLDNGFVGLKARYASDITDQPIVITIVAANGSSKSVEEYAQTGPKKLAEIESRIDLLFEQVRWSNEATSSTTQSNSR